MDAATDLGGRDVREARRLVRRGQVAEEVAIARYAVAFARDRQRRNAGRPSFRSLIAIGMALALTGAVLAVDAFARANDVNGIAFTGIAVFFLYCLRRTWQERGNVEEAERVNREYLRRAGAPYAAHDAPTVVRLSPVAVACSFAVQVAIFIPIAGIVTRLLSGDPLSPGRALSAGLPGAAGFAIAILFAIGSSQSHDQLSAGRP